MPNNFRWATSLTGGGAGALDAIDGAILADGDPTIVVTSAFIYHYRVNATSGAAESSPGVISPDNNAGDKRHILHSIYLNTPTITGDITGDGSYLVGFQNFQDLAAKGPSYWLDGVNDQIIVAETAHLKPGTGDFSILVTAKNTGNDGAKNRLFSNYESGGSDDGIDLNIDNTGELECSIWENNTVRTAKGTADIGADCKNHNFVLSVDRSSSTGLKLFIDGDEITYSSQGDISTLTGDISPANANYIGIYRDGSTSPFAGQTSIFYFFNLALDNTDAADKAIINGGAMPFEYIGASRTEMITDSDDRDFTGGDIGNWVVATDGDGTVTYDAGPGAVKTGLITVGGTPGTSTAARLPTAQITTFEQDKTYLIKADIYIPSANNNWSSILIGGTTFTPSWGTRSSVDGNMATEDAWQTIEREVYATSDVTGNIQIVGASTTTGDIFYIDNISVTQIGCALQLDQDGIGHNQWIDGSGNELHGTVSGALPTNLPADHKEKYVDLALTGDSSFTLPMGYQVTAITFKSDGSIGGGIDVGTTDGGGEVVAACAIGAAGTYPATIILSGSIGGTHTTADDILYITDADGTGWDARTVEVRVDMRRLTMN